MTADAGDVHARGHGKLFRLGMWFGHHAQRWANPLTATGWAGLTVSWWLPTDSAIGLVVAIAMTIAMTPGVIMLLCQDFVHDRNLCLRDVQESPLLDPQAAVTRHLRYLRAHHDPRLRKILITSGPAPIIAMMIMPGATTYPAPFRVAMTVLAAAGFSVLIYVSRVETVHRRLFPWCPWCRRRDDGDPVQAPTPDPAGTIKN